MKRFILLILLMALAVGAVSHDAEAARKRKAVHVTKISRTRAPEPDRYADIVMEATTGTILSQTNPDKRLYPASLTKMMTMYLTFEAIQNGKISKNDRISVSSRASMQEPSKLGLAPGSTIRVEDAILGVVTKSANDAAVTLAEAIGGSEPRFAQLMTAKAQSLGMRSTHYANASGLHNPDNYSSARDQALLGQALIHDFPREYKYFSTSKFVYAGAVHTNHNRLMSSYEGMDGIKTGYVYASGYNLAASAVRGGRRLIGVVFGGQTTVSRNNQMAKLLDAGFESLRNPVVAAQIEKHRLELANAAKQQAAGTPAAAAPGATATTQAATAAARFDASRYASQNPDVPSFNAIGLVTEQGDTDEGYDSAAPAAAAAAAAKQQPAAKQPAAKQVAVSKPPVATTPIAPAKTKTAAAAPVFPTPAPIVISKNPAPVPVAAVAAPTALAAPAAAAPAAAPAAKVASAAGVAGNWTVQVGAYNSRDASLSALKQVKQKLPASMTGSTQYLIAPLMTSRGMIYRARLGGLKQDQANGACRILKGSCLVMAVQ